MSGSTTASWFPISMSCRIPTRRCSAISQHGHGGSTAYHAYKTALANDFSLSGLHRHAELLRRRQRRLRHRRSIPTASALSPSFISAQRVDTEGYAACETTTASDEVAGGGGSTRLAANRGAIKSSIFLPPGEARKAASPLCFFPIPSEDERADKRPSRPVHVGSPNLRARSTRLPAREAIEKDKDNETSDLIGDRPQS